MDADLSCIPSTLGLGCTISQQVADDLLETRDVTKFEFERW